MLTNQHVYLKVLDAILLRLTEPLATFKSEQLHRSSVSDTLKLLWVGEPQKARKVEKSKLMDSWVAKAGAELGSYQLWQWRFKKQGIGKSDGRGGRLGARRVIPIFVQFLSSSVMPQQDSHQRKVSLDLTSFFAPT